MSVALTSLVDLRSYPIQSLAFPMLSSSIFSPNGSIYHQSAVFGHTFELNKTALAEVGLPALTGSNAWNNLTGNLAVSFSRACVSRLLLILPVDWGFGRSRHPLLGTPHQRFIKVGQNEDATR